MKTFSSSYAFCLRFFVLANINESKKYKARTVLNNNIFIKSNNLTI